MLSTAVAEALLTADDQLASLEQQTTKGGKGLYHTILCADLVIAGSLTGGRWQCWALCKSLAHNSSRPSVLKGVFS